MAETAPTPSDDFTGAWQRAESIPGWLTKEQARLLWDEATRLRPGAVVLEIGSHRGRSTTVLASAVQRFGGTIVAVDPFVEGRLFGGKSTRDEFEANLAEAGVRSTVEHLADYSTSLRPGWTRSIDLLYIDGKHDYWTLSDDLRWSEHLPAGGRVLVHDAYSSIGVTTGILARVLPSSRLRYLHRVGSMALFEVGPPTTADRGRILSELPWWLRNVFIKVLLRLGLRPVARLLGHDSPYDPY